MGRRPIFKRGAQGDGSYLRGIPSFDRGAWFGFGATLNLTGGPVPVPHVEDDSDRMPLAFVGFGRDGLGGLAERSVENLPRRWNVASHRVLVEFLIHLAGTLEMGSEILIGGKNKFSQEDQRTKFISTNVLTA